MSIYALAAELGKAIKADERMIRMEKNWSDDLI